MERAGTGFGRQLLQTKSMISEQKKLFYLHKQLTEVNSPNASQINDIDRHFCTLL